MKEWHPVAHEFHDELVKLQDKYLKKLDVFAPPDQTEAQHREWHNAQNSLISVLISEAVRACYQAGVPIEVALRTVHEGYEHEEALEGVVCLDCEREKRK